MAKTFFPELTRVLFLLLTAAAAQADPVTWTVNNANFEPGPLSGALIGTFDYDADTAMYSNVNLHTTSSFIGDVEYTAAVGVASGLMVAQSSSNSQWYLRIFFGPILTNAGGVVGIVDDLYSQEYSEPPSYIRYMAGGGTVTGVPVVVPPVNVAVKIQPSPGIGVRLHPHHDGSASSPAGLNDVIRVGVLGSLISVGDPVDFTANEIAPATLRFGPDQAEIRPGSTPLFNVDLDFDGINDARFEFLTGDTGIACLDTAATLTGQTNTGTPFVGVASFTTNCDAQCH